MTQMYGYMILSILATMAILFALLKWEQHKAETERTKRKESDSRRMQSEAVIVEQARTSKAEKVVEVMLRNKRKEDQVKIDSGDRSGFDNSEY